MAITIVERRTCDWCGEDQKEDDNPVLTHRLVFDRAAREVELHDGCRDQATLVHLIEQGRKPSAAEIAAAQQPIFYCPVCQRPCKGYMGVAQHLAQGHKDVAESKRKAMLAELKASQNPG